MPDPEQVLEVPRISPDRTRQRLGDSLRQPQTADQLVEVPTIVSFSSLYGNVEQNAGIPVPPGRVGVRGLQGFPPGLDSAASSEQTVHIPVPHGGWHDLHPPSAVDF